MLELLSENSRRREIDELHRSYMALIVPILGGNDADTWESVLERYTWETRIVTRDEVKEAEQVGKDVAAAFGML